MAIKIHEKDGSVIVLADTPGSPPAHGATERVEQSATGDAVVSLRKALDASDQAKAKYLSEPEPEPEPT